MRWLHVAMAVLFVFSAGLQLNDPDPWGWVVIYLAAAALAGLGAAGRYPVWRRPLALAVAGVALAWAMTVSFSSPRLPPFTELFGDWEMHAAGVEDRREALGLLAIAAWSALVAVPGRAGVTGRASSATHP